MRRVRVLLTLMALVVTACGGQGGAGATGDEVTEEANGRDSENGGEATLAGFFGWDAGEDPAATEADHRDREARIQESIRRCMAEQGFEYSPVLPPAGSFVSAGDWDEEEQARTHGFGITTWYGNEEMTETTVAPGEEWVDPNMEMVETMSESERTAWYDALHGTAEEQAEDMVTEVDPETGEEYQVSYGYGAGCQGEAYEAEYGDQQTTEKLWQELQPEMDAMYQRVQADPRIVELDQEWSACMAERGYQYESMSRMHETVYQDLQTRFEEIVGPDGGYADPFAGWTEEEITAFFEEKTQEEIDAFLVEAERQSREAIDMEALAALQQEEIDLAVADFECRGDYWEVYQEVSEEYEAEFIQENREILEEIRDAQGGGGRG